MRILFICSGNRSRSVLAEYLLRHIAAQKRLPVEVRSAGTDTIDGRRADPLTVCSLREWGIDATEHRTQSITPELIEWADWVLTATLSHRDKLREWFPEASAKIFTLAEFVGEFGSINDPNKDTLTAFNEVRDRIYRLIQKLVEKIESGSY
jgi:Protein-tyrosine-phosphatase